MRSSKNILTFFLAQAKQGEIELQAGEPRVVTVGSAAGGVDMVLRDAAVSRVHAQLTWDGAGACELIDSGSTNGTFVNGVRLPAHGRSPLFPGDAVTFGSAQARMSLTAGASAQTPPPQAAPAAQSLLARLQHKLELSIGRQADCDVVIDSPLASRLHARLRLLPDGRILLIDLQSTNGTFLNGQRVVGSVEIQQADKVVIGRTVLTLDGGARSLGNEVAIRAEGIAKRYRDGKSVLQPTDLAIAAGSMVAIMGPSGCGKSTLLRCLTGESPASQGKVFLYNLELIQHYGYLKTLIGYVPQDDIVHTGLTVEQALYYAARLRMEKPTRSEIARKIDDVLARLRIDHIRQQPIAKISGGQRKRVSIAVELLTDPLILFLDEPTSPLDPQTIAEFLEILKALAAKGTTVVMVTHKPEDLDYMDEVIFLAEGGHLVYHGPAAGYKAYFGVRTAVEVYAAICGPGAATWVDKFRGRQAPVATSAAAGKRTPKRATRRPFSQLRWLSARYFRLKTNDPINVAILIGQAPIIAGLICFIFPHVTLSLPFVITLSAIWFGTSNAAREIVGEAAIYRRERMYNLRIGPYLLSKMLVLALLGAVQSVLFSIIIRAGFADTNPAWSSSWVITAWIWGLTVVASAMGLAISSVVNTAEKAMALVPLVLIPQVMLAGVVTRITQFPVELLSYASPTRWGNEGLTLMQGYLHDTRVDGIEDMFIRENLDSTVAAIDVLADQYHPSYVETYGYQALQVETDALMLIVICLVNLLAVWVSLRRKDSI